MKKLNLILMVATISIINTSLLAINQRTLFKKPGVMGDSLSQGFYGATVEGKTQDWSYPVLVSKQAGSNVTYNKLKGPYINIEDIMKWQCGPFCIARSVIGGNSSKVSLPSHAGITGADYSDALYKSGQCENINAKKWVRQWYWKGWWPRYRWVQKQDCQKPDKFHRYGLRNSGTQMQIMEKNRPSFVFASVGANHVLCTALGTSLDCLDETRFKRDFAEVTRRLDNISSVKGGVIFTVPNVTAIAYLEPYRDPRGRSNYSGLKAFYRNSVSSPSQVLDAGEVNRIENFVNMLNGTIAAKAAALGYALTDTRVIFDDIKENGREIRSSSGYSPGLAQANWPLKGKPGIFGLDGVHPNRYGHAVMANELISSINARYGTNISLVDEYSAWYHDSLNRKPVDLKDFLSNNLFGKFISWIIGIFV